MIQDKLKTIAIYGIGGAFFLGLLWLTLKFALPVLLPFAIAFFLSCLIRGGAKRLSSLTKMSEGILCAILLFSGLAALGVLIWFSAATAIKRLCSAITEIFSQPEGTNMLSELSSSLSDYANRLLGEDFAVSLENFLSRAISQISSHIASSTASIFSALPSFAIGLAISVAALFYFTFGYDKTAAAIKCILPKNQKDNICKGVSLLSKGLGRFLRAYSTIILVTFTELFVGFLILRIDHAFILAAIISIVDFLPIIGVGGVLIPWAATSLFMKKTGQAIGLVVITAIVWAIRQPVESKLIGRGAGVHPIFALASVYTGFRMAGVFGMVAAPVLLTAVSVVLREKNR